MAQLKKQTPQIKTEPEEKLEIVKEDCHIQIDDSSYGDWLLTQGIQLQMSPPSATPIVISPKLANLPVMMNMDPVKTATLTEMDMQNKVPLPEQSQKNINTEDLDKLAKTQQNTEEKEEKQLDQAGVSQEVQVQSLTEPNYLLQMQTLIDQGASEEESLERIQKLKDILHIMENKHKPYQPNPTAKKSEGSVKDNKTEPDNDNIEQKEKEKEQVLNKENKEITPKDKTPDKDLNVQSTTKPPDTIPPQQPTQPSPSDMQKDTKIEKPDAEKKDSQSVDGMNDPNPKRVSFNLESNMVLQITEDSKLSDDAKISGITDTQILGVNIANYAFTDLDADNALSDLVIDANDDVNNNNDFNFLDTGNASDDTDIVGDEDFDIPCSQIIHKDP